MTVIKRWKRILCRPQTTLEGNTIPNIPMATTRNGQIIRDYDTDEREWDAHGKGRKK